MNAIEILLITAETVAANHQSYSSRKSAFDIVADMHGFASNDPAGYLALTIKGGVLALAATEKESTRQAIAECLPALIRAARAELASPRRPPLAVLNPGWRGPGR
ncbi:MAG TPA: hypothetical protein VIM56_00765 [Rhizomicrobium sp.]